MAETDWNLIIQGNISLIWCQWATDPKNRDKIIGQLLDEFQQQYRVTPLNAPDYPQVLHSIKIKELQTKHSQCGNMQILISH